MISFPGPFRKLIDDFSKLPSIGPRLAERLVFFLFKQQQQYLDGFSQDLKALKSSISYCPKCFNLSENGLCLICRDSARDPKTVCVVEDPLDIIPIEKTGNMKGYYHVLGGNISDESKQGELKVQELIDRIAKENVGEVILATNPTAEGEATALYLARLIKSAGARATRLARGLPTGGDIEYADEQTLRGALEGRKDL